MQLAYLSFYCKERAYFSDISLSEFVSVALSMCLSRARSTGVTKYTTVLKLRIQCYIEKEPLNFVRLKLMIVALSGIVFSLGAHN